MNTIETIIKNSLNNNGVFKTVSAELLWGQFDIEYTSGVDTATIVTKKSIISSDAAFKADTALSL